MDVAGGERVPWHPSWGRGGATYRRVAGVLAAVTAWFVFMGLAMTFGVRGYFLTIAGFLSAATVAALWTMRWRARTRRRASEYLVPWMPDGFGTAHYAMRTRNQTGPYPWARPVGLLLTFGGMGLFFGYLPTAGSRWASATGAASYLAGLLLSNRGSAIGRVDWETTPLRAGDRAKLSFRYSKESGRPAAVERVTLTLRCLAARRRWADLLRPEVRCLWSQEFVRAGDLPPSPLTVDMEVDLPADAPGTDLLAEPVVFWELAAVVEGATFRYRDEFLIPVYARGAGEIVA